MTNYEMILRNKGVEDNGARHVWSFMELFAVVENPYAILKEDVRNRVSEMLECDKDDFYILPSSIYEVLCIRKKATPVELLGIVRDMNENEVAEKDQFTTDVFMVVDGEIVSAV